MSAFKGYNIKLFTTDLTNAPTEKLTRSLEAIFNCFGICRIATILSGLCLTLNLPSLMMFKLLPFVKILSDSIHRIIQSFRSFFLAPAISS